MDEKALERLAVKELLQEAERGKERYKSMGPSGWQKNLVPRANKQFLQRTLANSVHSSMRREYVSRKRKADDDKRVCDTEKKEMKYKQKKFADDAKSQHKATLKNNPNVFSAQKSKTKQSISKARTDSKTA